MTGDYQSQTQSVLDYLETRYILQRGMLPRIAFPFLFSLSDAGPITSDIELKVSHDQFKPRVNSEKF